MPLQGRRICSPGKLSGKCARWRHDRFRAGMLEASLRGGTQMNTSAAVLIGSAISAIVAMAVVALQHSLERRKQSLAERAERLGEFLASSYAVAVGIEEVAIAPTGNKAAIEVNVRSIVEDRFNSCLTRLRLFEDADIVAAATYLEREMTRLMGAARDRVWPRGEWRVNERTLLARLTGEYEAIARYKLRRKRLQKELSFYDVGADSSA